jgi:hypothetical protein
VLLTDVHWSAQTFSNDWLALSCKIWGPANRVDPSVSTCCSRHIFEAKSVTVHFGLGWTLTRTANPRPGNGNPTSHT